MTATITTPSSPPASSAEAEKVKAAVRDYYDAINEHTDESLRRALWLRSAGFDGVPGRREKFLATWEKSDPYSLVEVRISEPRIAGSRASVDVVLKDRIVNQDSGASRHDYYDITWRLVKEGSAWKLETWRER